MSKSGIVNPFRKEDFVGVDYEDALKAIEFVNKKTWDYGSRSYPPEVALDYSKVFLSGYNAAWVYLTSNNRSSASCGYCHANLKYYTSTPKLILSRLLGHKVIGNPTEDMINTFYTWLINDSPWAPAFACKKWDLSFPFVFLNPNVQNTLMYAAAIVSRSPWEFKGITKWYELVKLGMPPSYAYLICSVWDTNYIWTAGVQEHWPLKMFSIKGSILKGFANGKINKDYDSASFSESKAIIQKGYVGGSVYCLFSDPDVSQQVDADWFTELVKGCSTDTESPVTSNPWSTAPLIHSVLVDRKTVQIPYAHCTDIHKIYEVAMKIMPKEYTYVKT